MIIFFATTAKVAWSAPLDKKIPEHVWKIKGGSTNYGLPLKMAFEHMCNKGDFKTDEHIKNFDYALMCFYTDGSAHYPDDEMDQIKSLLAKHKEDWCVKGKANKSKLRTMLLSEMEDNPTMDQIKEKWDKMFQNMGMTSTLNGELCEIMNSVDTNAIGKTFIQEFAKSD